MDFFSKCKDKEEAKKTFHNLAKFFHPDKGGDSEMMIELKKQYDNFNPNLQKNDPLIFKTQFGKPNYPSGPPSAWGNQKSRESWEWEILLIKKDYEKKIKGFMENEEILIERERNLKTELRNIKDDRDRILAISDDFLREIAEKNSLIEDYKVRIDHMEKYIKKCHPKTFMEFLRSKFK